MKPIRVGIVGAGENTRLRHIPQLQAIEGVEIVSVVNRRKESSERVAKDYGIPVVYDSWEKLVEAEDTDAIVIGTWPYLHCPVTLAALDAGKHVMTEARMSMDVTEARNMLAAAEKRPDLVTQVVPSPFSLPLDRTISRMIREGYLGEVLAVDVQAWTGSFLEKESPMHWRQDQAYSGKNIMTLGIWYEAVMRWIGEATQVQAMGKVFVESRKDPISGQLQSVKIPEHLVVTAEMENNAMATFQVSNVKGGVPANEAQIIGSHGTLLVANGELFGCTPEQPQFSKISIPKEEAIGWRVEEEFINAIRGVEKITHTTFADGVRYMKFTEGVHKSLQESRKVDLSEI